MSDQKRWSELEARGKAAHEAWLKKIGYTKPLAAPTDEESASVTDEQPNALELALSRTPHGQQLLALLGEAAMLRLHEGLAAELVRGAAEDVERLRRALLGRDLVARERAAAQIPHAETELAKWQRAHADYQRRREHLEYTLRDGMRAFTA